MSRATSAVITVVIIGLIIAFAVPVYDTVTTTGSDFKINDRVDETVNIEGETGNFVEIKSNELGENESVRDSRGYAVRLTGADDSFVESDSQFSFASDGNWTVATWARVNDSAGTKNMTAISLNGRVLIQYNGTQGNWSVWYYDEGAANSWRANVSAPNQAGNYSSIIATHNGSHLQIYRNGTQGDVVNTSGGDNIADIQINSTNWNGSIDETRTFDDSLNSSQRDALVQSPVGPLANATRTARLMYDAGSGTEINIYFTSTSATGSNINYVDGLDGNELAAGSDYEWQDDGPEIKPLSGGEVDGAPAIFVKYDFTSEEGLVVTSSTDALSIAPIILIAVIAGVVIASVRRLD